MKLIEIAIAIVSILIAIYNFDIYNPNRCIASVLLLMSAVMTLSKNKKLNRFLRIASVILAIVLFFRLLMYG